MKVAAVSTFRCPCGVAKEWEALAYELDKLVDLKTYAEVIHDGSQEDKPINPNQPLKYIRDWKRGETFDYLYEDIIQDMPDLAHVSFESAMYNCNMYNEGYLEQLLNRLHKAGIPTVITLHNVPAFNPATLYSGWYLKCNSHFITTNQLMEKELRKWEPNIKATTIPLGSILFTPTDTETARQQLNLPKEKYLITQVGFFGADKGMLPLIQAMPRILEKIPNAYLVLAGSLHPLAPPVHKAYLQECIKTAYRLGLTNNVKFTGKFLSEEDLSLYLSATDIVAINHAHIFGLYSSSASAHRALSSGRPILMNKDDVRLSEFKDGVHCLKNTNDDIPEKVLELYQDANLQKTIIHGALEYAQKTSYHKNAEKHLEVYENLLK
jgi:glycosyltransferase involved in cell wall biosynthesis